MDGDAAADPRMVVGQRVREYRQVRQYSQEELAARAGLHPTYVSGIERGHRNLSIVNLYRLAAALGVSPGELVPPLSNAAHDI